MMMTPALVLAQSEEDAEERAKKYFEHDPFPLVKPSLLSATEIVEYVERTGMIYPFDPSDSFLKHASYEGRIGKKVFFYDATGERVQQSLASGFLHLEHDSITFVECNIRFRLPRYIAVRFNLHIKHVHRGLLLGTGPLVDPGFNGKLLIPIHNLTSDDYDIPIDEGLIWIEFTKTTYDENVGHKYGSFPPRKNIAEVEGWLDRVEVSPRSGERVPIRNSVPLLVKTSNERAEEARVVARDARKIANRVQGTFWKFSIWGFIASVLAILALIAAFGITIYQQFGSQAEFIQQTYSSLDGLRERLDSQGVEMEALRVEIEAKSDFVQQTNESLEALRAHLEAQDNDIQALRAEIKELQGKGGWASR